MKTWTLFVLALAMASPAGADSKKPAPKDGYSGLGAESVSPQEIGVNDPRVPVGEALQMYKELEKRRIPGGLILFADEGHGATKRGNIVATIGHTIAFMQKHLTDR